ncbi:DsbA family protein [Azorhizobium doebereinerae]|uniref:DsbA family protein n=1 Tax=Azorhizobium doebereinerae TaxID=281091 RepID=UPI00041AE7E1|nr:DsbA family protein [Azorhizobium doebereinerae]
MTIRLHYIYDPLCGWCYAAAPLVAAAAAAPDVELVPHAGGLFPGPQSLPPGMHQHIKAADARIAVMTGQVFGPAYLEGLLPDPGLVLNSLPPIAAILAAEALEAGGGLRMLAAIQRAHYVDGRRVAEDGVLRDLAREMGLDTEAFGAAMAAQPVAAHLGDTRRRMAQSGIGGFPGFVREQDGTMSVLPHAAFYGQPAAFLDHLRAAA